MSGTKKKKPAENKAADPATVSPDKKESAADSKMMAQVMKALEETNKKLDALQKDNDKKEKETEVLREEIKKLKSKPAGSNDHDQEVIDDYMDVPVVFFCYSFAFSLPSYKRRGRTVKAPNENIRFKLLHRYKLGEGAQAKIHAVSAVKIHSKADLKYLREFPGYGYKIHEKDEGPARIDTMLADFLTKEASRVNNLNDHAMITACQTENIPANTDLSLMRRQLIQKRAENAMANFTKQRKVEEEKAVKMAVNAQNIARGTEPAFYDKTVTPEVVMPG